MRLFQTSSSAEEGMQGGASGYGPRIVSVAEMWEIEHEADQNGISYAQMMENAGHNLAQSLIEDPSRVGLLALALVGPGNNGGDALVALETLAKCFWRVAAFLARPRENDPLVERVKQAGGRVFGPLAGDNFGELGEVLFEADVLLDGLLGTGAHPPVKSDLAGALAYVQRLLDDWAPERPRPRLVAVDCPSGVDCDSGLASPETLRADMTVTMAAVKQGLLRLPAAGLTGDLTVVPIGNLESLASWQRVQTFLVQQDWVRRVLPERPADAYKGTFGTALVCAGSINFSGAAWLAGQAAYRVGTGLVTLAVPIGVHAVLAGSFPEATWVLLPQNTGFIDHDALEVLSAPLESASALLLGPGWGVAEGTQAFLRELLSANLPPLVVDADGLKLLARIPDWPDKLPQHTVLTPHLGEMSILTGQPKEKLHDKLVIARQYAKCWGQVVVLKGAYTVIANPDGRACVIPVASPALARAGTGDVLAGLIAGLRAQGCEAFVAATAGAWLHAHAGLSAAARVGSSASVLAGDVLAAIPGVLRELRYP